MRSSYYVNIVSYGKMLGFKINTKTTGEYTKIFDSSKDPSAAVPFDKNTYLTLYKQAKGKKQTIIEDCRQGCFKNINIKDCSPDTIQKIFALMVRLYENGTRRGLPLHSFEFMNNVIYPAMFNR